MTTHAGILMILYGLIMTIGIVYDWPEPELQPRDIIMRSIEPGEEIVDEMVGKVKATVWVQSDRHRKRYYLVRCENEWLIREIEIVDISTSPGGQ